MKLKTLTIQPTDNVSMRQQIRDDGDKINEAAANLNVEDVFIKFSEEEMFKIGDYDEEEAPGNVE